MSKSTEFWNKSADNYDKSEKKFEFIHLRARDLTRKYLNENDVVLDYGCGTGTNACDFAGLVDKIHAIDISSRMIEIAKGKATLNNVHNASFLEADIFDESLQKESFDVILAFNMLHTVPDPERVVQRTLEILKPGGAFVSVTPCLRGRMSFLVRLQILIMRILLAFRIIPVPIRQLKPADLDGLVAVNGYQVIDANEIYKGVNSYFMVAKKCS